MRKDNGLIRYRKMPKIIPEAIIQIMLLNPQIILSAAIL